MNICITGHRNCAIKEEELDILLSRIIMQYPDPTLLIGGAKGFDTFVINWSNKHAIAHTIIKPDYTKYHYKRAPLERNKVMVEKSDCIVAYYDGRKTGGTAYAVAYAQKTNKLIHLIK